MQWRLKGFFFARSHLHLHPPKSTVQEPQALPRWMCRSYRALALQQPLLGTAAAAPSGAHLLGRGRSRSRAAGRARGAEPVGAALPPSLCGTCRELLRRHQIPHRTGSGSPHPGPARGGHRARAARGSRPSLPTRPPRGGASPARPRRLPAPAAVTRPRRGASRERGPCPSHGREWSAAALRPPPVPAPPHLALRAPARPARSLAGG